MPQLGNLAASNRGHGTRGPVFRTELKPRSSCLPFPSVRHGPRVRNRLARSQRRGPAPTLSRHSPRDPARGRGNRGGICPKRLSQGSGVPGSCGPGGRGPGTPLASALGLARSVPACRCPPMGATDACVCADARREAGRLTDASICGTQPDAYDTCPKIDARHRTTSPRPASRRRARGREVDRTGRRPLPRRWAGSAAHPPGPTRC